MNDGCVFCDYAGPNTVLWETPAVYVVEPLRQVTPGHLLVIPREHAADFADNPAVTAAAFRGAAEYAQANGLEDANLITSRGPAASQTVHHIHIHILPRTWDDAVRLPWNNPHVSPSPTHHLYRRVKRETDALLETLSSLRESESGMFDWELDEARALVGHADRYLGKVGEVLFCGYHDCLHADEEGGQWGDERHTDYKGRAIPIGEGVQYFKGKLHNDCWRALQKERRR